MIGVFVGFSRIFLLGILIFKGLTARRLYKSFGVKGLHVTGLLHVRWFQVANETAICCNPRMHKFAWKGINITDP
jgi:hypothetical protein